MSTIVRVIFLLRVDVGITWCLPCLTIATKGGPTDPNRPPIKPPIGLKPNLNGRISANASQGRFAEDKGQMCPAHRSTDSKPAPVLSNDKAKSIKHEPEPTVFKNDLKVTAAKSAKSSKSSNCSDNSSSTTSTTVDTSSTAPLKAPLNPPQPSTKTTAVVRPCLRHKRSMSQSCDDLLKPGQLRRKNNSFSSYGNFLTQQQQQPNKSVKFILPENSNSKSLPRSNRFKSKESSLKQSTGYPLYNCYNGFPQFDGLNLFSGLMDSSSSSSSKSTTTAAAAAAAAALYWSTAGCFYNSSGICSSPFCMASFCSACCQECNSNNSCYYPYYPLNSSYTFKLSAFNTKMKIEDKKDEQNAGEGISRMIFARVNMSLLNKSSFSV